MDRDKPIKKAVETVHITTKLSLLERKVFNALLWKAYPALAKTDIHKIGRKELNKLIGSHSRNQKAMDAALDKLNTTQIKLIRFEGTRKEETLFTGFIAGGKLKSGTVEYSFSPQMREILYYPQVYTRFFLEVQRRLSSYQTLALYENCKRFQNVRSTGWVEVDTWRKLLGVEKLPSYANFKTFNANVIKKAVKDINEYSDITITPEFKRESRRVSAIKFKIKPNPQPTLFEQPDDQDDMEDRYKQIVAAMDDDELKQLQEKFKNEILKETVILRDRYNKDGFESRMVQVSFQEYVVEQASKKPVEEKPEEPEVKKPKKSVRELMLIDVK